MDPNSDTQDIVDTTATENTGDERQEHEEQHEGGEGQKTEPAVKEGEGEEGQQPEPQKDEPKPKNRAQERIQQLAREKAEMAAKLAEYEAKQNAPKPLEAPRVEDFEDYSEYQKAQQEWYIEQAEQRVLSRLQQEKQQQTQAQREAEFQSAIVEAVNELPDFDRIVQAGIARDLPLPISLDEVAAEFGYDAKTQTRLLYELAKDEDFHEQVSTASKMKAARLLSEKADSFTKTPAAPKIPNAPKPIKPTSANAPVKRSEDSMSDEEFLAKRRAERLKG